MNYAEAIEFLYGLQMFGASFGLENTFRLSALLGTPQEKLRFIHVAGTNGKGSTCAMLESIYRAAGLRVGLFTSPHLVSFRERIQINRRLIPEGDIVRLVDQLRAANSGNAATLFEFATVMALTYFAENSCDLVIWETGLGGRLDATNIVLPLASVITNIALDHQQWLGETLEKIAAEKAGIIKPGVPVITATEEPSALAVIEKIAAEQKAPLVKINSMIKSATNLLAQSNFPIRPNSLVENLTLPGDHQKVNAALALATIEQLQNQLPVSESAIRAGLAGVNWPGRLQLLQTSSGQRILLDGAHNLAGAKVLRDALIARFSVGSLTLILGILQDKNWAQICRELAPLARKIIAVPVSSQRRADPVELAAVCHAAHPSADVFQAESLAAALQKISGDDLVVVTGSLYLVGEALELLGFSPANSGERELNEWQAKR